ncbi:uncharacterized protein BO80DRAFT_443673 [Aspergillus ibericus CBS 121593]|uniref:Uncharacterized protein n=1 Tax=Aspergillus ibericus CBS 121593 TaxID=1448316 RepID=A0A395H3B9_9EURO|nr:hypothetical protein BO80DRAFT_443673 [Aspergillus ibericus CBS 121593]RAL02362.1 hypothetical protein BO80DRAFT_443673 [Aspergillus ibericus CBS 121593]
MAAGPGPKPFRVLLRHHRDLFVNPLFWTSRHLDLVGCRFEDVDTANDEPTQASDCGTGGDRNFSDVESLATNLILGVKYRCLVSILVGEGHAFAKSRKGSPFFFAGRPVHRPHYTVFRRHGQPNDLARKGSPPLIGYLHYTDVTGDRLNEFEPCPDPSGRLNFIGASIRNKRVAQITPKDWTEDPYYVCVMLALAQLQERKLDSPKPIIYTSRLLVTNALDKEYIHLYEVEISARLLEDLRNPTNATEYTKWPNIRHKKLPFAPYATFTDRIVTELVAPSHPNSSPPDDMNGVIMHGAKRALDQESSEQCKVRRTS